jgi:hypothetical protein
VRQFHRLEAQLRRSERNCESPNSAIPGMGPGEWRSRQLSWTGKGKTERLGANCHVQTASRMSQGSVVLSR